MDKDLKKILPFSMVDLISTLSLSIFVPLLSIIMTNKGLSKISLGWFFAIFSFVIVFTSPIVGKISDNFGRKNMIRIGIGLQIIALFTYYYYDYIVMMFLARIIDGIAFSIIAMVSISAIEDKISVNRAKFTGFALGFSSVGHTLGALLGAWISDIFFAKTTMLFSVVFLIFNLFILYFIKEEHIKKKVKVSLNPISEWKNFLLHKKLRGMGILGIVMHTKGQLFMMLFPLLLVQVLNYPQYYIGIYIGILSFFHIFQAEIGRYINNYNPSKLVMVGCFVAALSMSPLYYLTNKYLIGLVMVIYSLANGVWNISALVLMSEIGEKINMEGEIIGSYLSISKMGSGIFVIIGGYFVTIMGINLIFPLLSLLVILGIIFSRSYLKDV